MKFYLGTDRLNWIERVTVPLCISYSTLRRRKKLPRALCSIFLDARSFVELAEHGSWTIPAKVWARDALTYCQEIGGIRHASIQDWMCEPEMIHGGILNGKRVLGTGLSVKEHQHRTVASYLELTTLAPDVPWLPVLQGYDPGEYLEHVGMYADAGVELRTFGRVGLGSVCKRQSNKQIHDLVWTLAGHGLKLHGFGMKKDALAAVSDLLASADSMAWSRNARFALPLSGCHHKRCNHCLRYALKWRDEVIAATQRRGQRFLSVQVNEAAA